MTIQQARIGLRARFTGIDHEFHNGARCGRAGTIVADAALATDGQNFGGGTCGWQADGQSGIYITALADLTAEESEIK